MLSPRTGALAHREFLIYTIGNGFSSVGLWVQRLAIGWLSWELSKSEIFVGVIAFSLTGPMLVLSPLFGVLIDRMEPLRAATLINGLMALWAVLLAVLSFTGLLGVELLLIVSILIGVTSAAYSPVRLSIIPSIVPRPLLPSAIGISSMIFNASRLVGPAIAGAVLVSLPVAVAFLINALSYAPLIYALVIIPARPVLKRLRESFLKQLSDGIAYVSQHRLIRLQLILTAWNSLFGRAILDLLPIYSDRFYSAGTNGLALLTAAAGAGALLAAFMVSRLGLESAQLQMGSIFLAILNAVALLAVPLSPSLTLGMVCVAVVGFGTTGAAVLSQTLTQVEVEDQVRGRVSSLWGMASLGGMAFGGLILSLLLHQFEISTATYLVGALALALPLVVLRWFRPRAAD
jgi:MFS family permease